MAATILEAALATLAATEFFDPISIGSRTFADLAWGVCSPVFEVEAEASDILSLNTSQVHALVKCFISISPGNPGKKPAGSLMTSNEVLGRITTQAERTADRFMKRWPLHDYPNRYLRLGVEQRLQDVSLAEYRDQDRIATATQSYLNQPQQISRVRNLVRNLRGKQSMFLEEICFALDWSTVPRLTFSIAKPEDSLVSDLPTSELVPQIRDEVNETRTTAYFDTEKETEGLEDRGDARSNAEKLDRAKIDEEMRSFLSGSNLQPVSRVSESSSATGTDDEMDPALRPRTKIGQSQNAPVSYRKSKRHEQKKTKSGTTFGQRRTFSRKLAESAEVIENNSPAATRHQWPAKIESPSESRLLILGSGTMMAEPVQDGALDLLLEYCRRLSENWATLQIVPSASISVTALVYDSQRNVASVVEVDLWDVWLLQELVNSAEFASLKSLREHMPGLLRKYRDLRGTNARTGLSALVTPWNGSFEDLFRYLQMTLQVLDLALLAHLNAHTSSADREWSEKLISIPAQPAPTMPTEQVLAFRPYRLACLDGLTRGRKIWVFHRQSEQPREPLCLSTSTHHLATIWGPLWAVPADERGTLIDHYNISGGQLYPVGARGGPPLLENERWCHWQRREVPLDDDAQDEDSTSSKESEPDWSPPRHLQQLREAEPFNGTNNLLIGATADNPRMKWYGCKCSMSKFKSQMRGSQRLHPLRSRGWFNYVSSTNIGLSLNTHGIGFLGTAIRQTDPGQTFKQGFLEEWENSPRCWNPRDLMDFRGVLVSACTFNAQRVRLVDLLKTDALAELLRRCQFANEDARARLMATLEDSDPFALVCLWEGNPEWRTDLGNALLVCIRALCRTGYDAQHDVFNVLWKPPHERKIYRLEFRPRDHPWINLLKDSEDSMTMAVLVEDRLAPPANPCRQQCLAEPTVLETAVVVNRSLSPVRHLERTRRRRHSDPLPPWRSADRRWRYIWKVRAVPLGASFRLPGSNRLKTIAALTDTHLSLEQSSDVFRLIKVFLRIKSSRKESHWEYASDNSDNGSADEDVMPVPVHVR